MTIPSWIKVGTKVKYQVNSKGIPRWNYLEDNKGKQWEYSEINKVHDSHFTVRLISRGDTWDWPLPSHENYYDGIYNKPGYVQPVEKPIESKPISRWQAIAREL